MNFTLNTSVLSLVGALSFYSLLISSVILNLGAPDALEKRDNYYYYNNNNYDWSSIRADGQNVPPPCRIAVRNTRFDNDHAPHSEILESIGAQIPARYLALNNQACNKSSLVFDYFVTTGGIARSWSEYFRESLQDTEIKHTLDNISRRYGRVFGNKDLSAPFDDEYHTTIEASCYCWKKFEYVLRQNNTCIFHESCDAFKDHPTAVWVSPHHSQYFLPTRFPRPILQHRGTKLLPTSNTTTGTATTAPITTVTVSKNVTIHLCIIGGGKRKNVDQLERYLRNFPPPNVLFHHFGSDPVFSMTNSSFLAANPPQKSQDYESFFHQISTQCDGILPLLTPFQNTEYFVKKRKLTGTIPVIVAYQKSFFMHEELFNIYRDHLPTMPQVIYETHGELDFDTSMTRFLDRLRERQSKRCNVRFKNHHMALCHYVGNNGKNFGDELGPVVVQRILQEHFDCNDQPFQLPIVDRRVDQTPTNCLWTVGSVLHLVQPGDSLWGTGINAAQLARQSTRISSNLTVYGLVRGPKTESTLRAKGILTEDEKSCHGDPALLLPFLFPELETPQRLLLPNETSPTFCFIPHYHDLTSLELINSVPAGVRIIKPDQHWNDVIPSIQKCDYVASSSLHGLVIADAMGIPILWFQRPDSVTKKTEGKFKYQDYLLSVRPLDTSFHPQRGWEKILDPDSYLAGLSRRTRIRIAHSILDTFPLELFERYDM